MPRVAPIFRLLAVASLALVTACGSQRGVLTGPGPGATNAGVQESARPPAEASGVAAERPESQALPPQGDEPPAAVALSEEPDPSEAEFEDLWDDEEPLVVSDPLEPFNRSMFWVNDKLYVYLFKPVVRVYRVVPEPVRESVSNFFSNLGTPVRFGNSLLQLKFEDAGNELVRFLFNSTFGVAGLFDFVKAQGGPTRKEEDFGQTLGRYGASQGFYLVLPLLGPSSLRDGVGMVADWYTDPLFYFLETDQLLALTVTKAGNELSLDKDTYESIRKQQLDPYVFIRNAYIQHRAEKVSK